MRAARIVYSLRWGQPHGEDGLAETAGVTELDTLSDLLVATAEGDRQAFARLYNLSASTLFAVALRMLRERAEAEEALQEAFLAIWKQARRFEANRGQALPWMIAIVRYRAIDRIRKQGRSPNTSATLEHIADTLAATDPGSAPPSATSQTLHNCIDRLKPDQQQTIRLAYYYGLTHEELAARLETPLGTIKSWVRRGLLQLKECLDQ